MIRNIKTRLIMWKVNLFRSILFPNKKDNMEKENTIEEIKKSILQNYVRGAFNETDISAFKQAFHPEFAIINIQKNGSFFLFTRTMWEEALKKRLADPN